MQRVLVVRGECHVIECAMEADGTSPAAAFLAQLRSGVWEPTLDDDRPDEQLRDAEVFLDFCKRLADWETPPGRGQYNYLRSGIWEFKRATKRLTWYDTEGDGQQVAKPPHTDRSKSDFPEHDNWEFPLFDYFIRLGHAFPKISQKTGDIDLNEAERVQAEDISHDTGS